MSGRRSPEEMRQIHEDQAEWNYIYQERLGILAGAAMANNSQVKLAKDTADAWLADLRKNRQHPDLFKQ